MSKVKREFKISQLHHDQNKDCFHHWSVIYKFTIICVFLTNADQSIIAAAVMSKNNTSVIIITNSCAGFSVVRCLSLGCQSSVIWGTAGTMYPRRALRAKINRYKCEMPQMRFCWSSRRLNDFSFRIWHSRLCVVRSLNKRQIIRSLRRDMVSSVIFTCLEFLLLSILN